jgi:diphosphomevalonate decarboxylase
VNEIEIQGQPASPADFDKVSQHLKRVCEELDFDPSQCFKVKSQNNFPQGTGLASSASAFAALTVATLGEILGRDEADRLRREHMALVSSLARRGSGSASRSVDGGFVKWDGESAHRVPCEWRLRDTIVMFSTQHKKVPSSEGHSVALTSPLFEQRLKTLGPRLSAVEEALDASDLSRLGPLIEEEALELHAIAATGTPSIDYLLPETRKFLETLKNVSSRDFYFTLDAGPNVHIISERDVSPELGELLKRSGLEGTKLWLDGFGSGPSWI